MDPIAPQRSLTEIVADRIREAVILGEFPIGTKLSEQKLADQLQVSRSPVREALVLLQIEGLVHVYPKRGSFVFSPDQITVHDLCEHRTILERACLEFAMRRNPERLMQGLKAGIERMNTAIRASDTKEYSRGDLAFHQAIIEASGNQSLIKVYQTTIGPLMAFRTHLFTITGVQLDRSMAEHAELLQACQSNDLRQAQAVCARHINHLADHFSDVSQPAQIEG